jgi:Ca-activated chloride channel family protein
MRFWIGFVFLVLTALAVGACSPGGRVSCGGVAGFGATPGGVQDMGTARELIANGTVPPPEAFTVEGMFSEHGLPLEGRSSGNVLDVRGALGWQEGAGWVQVGFSSNVDPETYDRPSQALVLLVDVSGSMSWRHAEYGAPIDTACALMSAVVAEMEAADAVGIAAFESSAALIQDFVPGDHHNTLEGAIQSLEIGGGTNMEAGLLVATGMFQGAALQVEQKRVLLLTDAQPNIGGTYPRYFGDLAQGLADAGVGLTVIGIGVGLNPAVMQGMINLRGGNGFSIFTASEVAGFIEENWPWMVCPLAYDLTLNVNLSVEFTLGEAYGFPGENESVELSSVFLSRRRGALLLRLDGEPFESLGADLELSYVTPQGDPIQQALSLRIPGDSVLDPSGRWFEQYSVRKTTALAHLVTGMRSAAELYGIDHEDDAISLLESVVLRFRADADAMIALGQNDQADLEREYQLASNLLQLMRDGASQGTLYGP